MPSVVQQRSASSQDQTPGVPEWLARGEERRECNSVDNLQPEGNIFMAPSVSVAVVVVVVVVLAAPLCTLLVVDSFVTPAAIRHSKWFCRRYDKGRRTRDHRR